MGGADLRMGRLFSRTSGRSFIAAIDHGVTIGVPPGAEDAVATVERVVACEPDAVLIAPGLLAKTGHLFAFRGAPAPVLRADWIINDPRLAKLDQGEQYRVLCSPKHAVELGADAFIMFLIMGVHDGAMFADNARAIAVASEDAHHVGLPLIVEVTLWGSRINLKDRKDPELLGFGCRMAVELGADAIKTENTGDAASMADIIRGCPAPVLVLGGAKTETPAPMLAATRAAMDAGAKGVVYGRNVWQADDPSAISRQLREVIHGRTAT
ncbi:MAG: fructose-bisphosphate aldolase [Chloroflexia bacterium]|nr:fructose-bisphosphate aldolase [Chloroflexia bacterium]